MEYRCASFRNIMLGSVVAMLAVGCQRNVEAEYQKVQPGMTEQQVDEILGPGGQTSELARGAQIPADVTGVDVHSVQYGNGTHYVVVLFEDGKVKEKRKQGF